MYSTNGNDDTTRIRYDMIQLWVSNNIYRTVLLWILKRTLNSVISQTTSQYRTLLENTSSWVIYIDFQNDNRTDSDKSNDRRKVKSVSIWNCSMYTVALISIVASFSRTWRRYQKVFNKQNSVHFSKRYSILGIVMFLWKKNK